MVGIHALEDSSLLWGGDPSITKFSRVLFDQCPSAKKSQRYDLRKRRHN